jgi:TPR repeat protein
MKRLAWCSLAVLGLGLWIAPEANAQYRGARDYMKRLNPPPARPPPAAPPALAAPGVAKPAAPVDPEKDKAEKEAALKRTVEFQKKRAEAGSSTAQYDLAVRYMTGDGVEKDLALAKKWLEEAAKNGHTYAPRKLEELNKLIAEEAKEAKAKPAAEGKAAKEPKPAKAPDETKAPQANDAKEAKDKP